MKKGNRYLTGLGLLVTYLTTQPVMALSEQGVRTLQQNHDAMTTETVESPHVFPYSSSLNDFLPDLIGPHLYVYLLQSDQFITLQGVVEAFWEE